MIKTDDGFCCSFNTINIEDSFVQEEAIDDGITDYYNYDYDYYYYYDDEDDEKEEEEEQNTDNNKKEAETKKWKASFCKIFVF